MELKSVGERKPWGCQNCGASAKLSCDCCLKANKIIVTEFALVKYQFCFVRFFTMERGKEAPRWRHKIEGQNKKKKNNPVGMSWSLLMEGSTDWWWNWISTGPGQRIMDSSSGNVATLEAATAEQNVPPSAEKKRGQGLRLLSFSATPAIMWKLSWHSAIICFIMTANSRGWVVQDCRVIKNCACGKKKTQFSHLQTAGVAGWLTLT